MPGFNKNWFAIHLNIMSKSSLGYELFYTAVYYLYGAQLTAGARFRYRTRFGGNQDIYMYFTFLLFRIVSKQEDFI